MARRIGRRDLSAVTLYGEGGIKAVVGPPDTGFWKLTPDVSPDSVFALMLLVLEGEFFTEALLAVDKVPPVPLQYFPYVPAVRQTRGVSLEGAEAGIHYIQTIGAIGALYQSSANGTNPLAPNLVSLPATPKEENAHGN